MGRALDRTAGLWPQVAQGAAWVRGASAILNNDEGLSADALMARYQDWIGQMDSATERPDLPDTLRKALSHFVKVSASYGRDLFHCYRIAELPRTNNALEQRLRQPALSRTARQRPQGRFAFAGAQWQRAHAGFPVYPDLQGDAGHARHGIARPMARDTRRLGTTPPSALPAPSFPPKSRPLSGWLEKLCDELNVLT